MMTTRSRRWRLPSSLVAAATAAAERVRQPVDTWIADAVDPWTWVPDHIIQQHPTMPDDLASQVGQLIIQQPDQASVWIAVAVEDGWPPQTIATAVGVKAALVRQFATHGDELLRDGAGLGQLFDGLPPVPAAPPSLKWSYAGETTAITVRFSLEVYERLRLKSDRLRWPMDRSVQQAISDRLFNAGVTLVHGPVPSQVRSSGYVAS